MTVLKKVRAASPALVTLLCTVGPIGAPAALATFAPHLGVPWKGCPPQPWYLVAGVSRETLLFGSAIGVQLMAAATFLGVAFILGHGVRTRGWDVALTRKALALLLIALPLVTLMEALTLAQGTTFRGVIGGGYSCGMPDPPPWVVERCSCWIYKQSTGLVSHQSLHCFLIGAAISAAFLGLLCQPLRRRFRFLETAFAAIDRPEDRPHTLTWVITSVVATYVVVGTFYALVSFNLLPQRIQALLLIAIVVAGVGDALAEPVGKYWGKNEYKVRALFTDRTYVRTWEGSLVVFASGVVGVLLVAGHLSNTEALLALLLFPAVLTLAEAKSPHTWDQPFIFLSWLAVSVALVPIAELIA